MDKNTNIEALFDSLKGDFDVEIPNPNHQDRFLAKLSAQNKQDIQAIKPNGVRLLKPLLAIAASILLLITLTFTFQTRDNTTDLASVSPEMAKTQSFFTAAIAQELQQLEQENSPEVQPLIADALKQLNILEKDYDNLKLDLNKSGNDKRVIYAMIANFQNRITILQNVLETIDNVKRIKNTSHESKITI